MSSTTSKPIPRIQTAIALARFVLIAATVSLLFGVPPQAIAIDSPAYVVMNDHGGDVETRIKEIKFVANHYSRIEIKGGVCLSSCTMFLGLPQTCINPKTKFGFHGPTDSGRPLTNERFDYWSAQIAAHYPANLERWYMSKARYLLKGYYCLTGAQLIKMGVRRC
ncbi:MAG: hypothetical protein ACRBBS_18245 [Thalassovita sp.]